MKISKILTITLLLGLFGYACIPSGYSSIAGDQVIITEVLYDTPGTDSIEEWIELFNPTSSEINITDWIIEDNYDTFNLTGVIPAKGYFVAAIDETGFFNLYGYYANQSGGWNSVALGNSGDRITLYDNDSVEVDYVAWEGGDVEWSSLSASWTTIRRTNATDTDTAGDWEDSLTTGDPGTGSYIIIPELPISLASIFFILFGIITFVGLSYRKK